MNKIFLLLLLISCSHTPKPTYPPEGLVTGETALEHIRVSYMKGCVDAFHSMKIPKVFEYCRDQAQKHKLEIEEIIEQVPE
jgi:hypothetical protein